MYNFYFLAREWSLSERNRMVRSSWAESVDSRHINFINLHSSSTCKLHCHMPTLLLWIDTGLTIFIKSFLLVSFFIALSLFCLRGSMPLCPPNRFVHKSLNYISPSVEVLIPLLWTSGDVCPRFQSQGGSLACILHHLHAMVFSDSPLVQHLLLAFRLS